MPIQLKFKLQRVSKGIRYDKNLDDNTTDWMTWWYCGLYKNKQADSQPNVLVAFRKLSDGLLSDDVILKRLPLTALGQFRLGTVWRDGMCRTDAMFKPYNFHVDFSEGAWTHSSFFEAASAEESPPFELDQYPLPYDKDKNWFIEFPRPTGGKLIIPCIEFFSRCFGKSAELKRVLATYPWEGEKGDLNSRLWLPTGEEEEPDKWMVKLAPRLAKDDAVFVAHAKYCPHAKRVAKGIYSQLETQYDSQNKNPAFLKTQPWFEGPATLVASGLWLKDKQSFLALRIIGCSDPKGVPIIRDRVKTDNDYADDGGGAKDRLSIPGRTLSKHPDIIDMTGYDEPDHEADKIEIQDPDFVVPGERRVVIDSKRYRTELASGVRRKGTEPSEFSCGEPYGSGKGVGYASIHAKPVMESHGALRDMWNALRFLSTKYPNLIQSLSFFTFEHGLQTEDEPRLIGLQPFDDAEYEKLPSDKKNWPYYDIDKMIPRGVLVMRVMAAGKPVYIIEIQRRPRKRKEKDGTVRDAEEPFMGLVYMLDDQSRLREWLRQFLAEIRYIKGVVKKLAGKCPGTADTFSHTSASDEQVPCEAAVINALSKMGIVLR